MINFNISIHDITKSNMENSLKIISLLNELGIKKFSLLLIPEYHKKENIKEVTDILNSISKEKEIILHGYYHIAERETGFFNKLFTSVEGEVLSINLEKFEHRVEKGLRVLNSIGLKPKGYIAPAWLIRKKHIKILKKYGFEFTTTRYGIYDLKNDRYIFSPVMSFGCRNYIQQISIKAFNPQLNVYQVFLKNIRIAIHPCDVNSKEKLELIKSSIKQLKKWGKESFLSEITGGYQNDKSRFTSSLSSIK